MPNWTTTSLSAVLDVIESGSRPKGGVTTEGDIPSLGGENIDTEGRLTFGELKRVSREFFLSMPRGHLQVGDVLINKDGAQTGKVAIYGGEFREASINEHLFLLRGRPDQIDQHYLYHALCCEFSQLQIARVKTGSAQAGINTRFASAVTLPLPIIEEQRRIAQLLGLVNRVIDAVRALVNKLEELQRGLLQGLFTYGLDQDGALREPGGRMGDFNESPLGPLPKTWKTRTFEEITDPSWPICYGIVQPGRDTPGGVPVVTIADLQGDYGSALHRTSKGIDARYSRSRIKPNDVLLSVKGTIGKTDLVPAHFEGNISRDIARIRPTREILPKYLRYMLECAHSQARLRAAIVGTTRPELSINVLRRLPLPVPPVREQEQIAAVAEKQRLRLQVEKALLEKLRYIKKGLMQDLMTGRVRVPAEMIAALSTG